MAVARTHVPRYHADRCLPCGACQRRCPVTVFPEQAREPDSLRALVNRSIRFPDPPAGWEGDGVWRPAAPPCRAACPLGQDVPGYVAAIAHGDPLKALAVIRETNPLPSTCGRLCPAGCMDACVRATLDEPVPIRALKRFAVDAERMVEGPVAPAWQRGPERALSVAVVGAGPAGLAAAWGLALKGWQVVIYEAAPEPGGLLRYGVGSFDLPREALRREIGHILELGIRLETQVRIGGRNSLEKLRSKGFSAVVVATGAGVGLGVNLPEWKKLKGTCDVVTFTRKVNTGRVEALDGPAVVLGGNVAGVTAARMALRLGADPVYLALPRTKAEAQDPRRFEQAEREGVRILEETTVVSLSGGQVLEEVGLAPLRLTRPDGSGRRRIVGPRRSKAWTVRARVFVSSGPRVVGADWLNGAFVRTGPLGNLLAGPDGHTLGPEWLFGAGEVVTGPKTVVEAVASGVRAAARVDAYLERLEEGGQEASRRGHVEGND